MHFHIESHMQLLVRLFISLNISCYNSIVSLLVLVCTVVAPVPVDVDANVALPDTYIDIHSHQPLSWDYPHFTCQKQTTKKNKHWDMSGGTPHWHHDMCCFGGVQLRTIQGQYRDRDKDNDIC